MPTDYVTYYRVSTDQQGRSGLGLEAQRAAIAAYLETGGGRLLASFEEVESGRRSDRPELAKALQHCRLTGSRLLIAKLDRLSRNVAFIAALMDSGVEFTACDIPTASRLTLHILAAVAEEEARTISQRTKAALQAAKARGTRLGNPLGAAAFGGLLVGAQAAREAADRFASQLAPIVAAIGPTSARNLSRELNSRGIRTPRGARWHPASARRLLVRQVAQA